MSLLSQLDDALPPAQLLGYKIVGDNIDKNIRPRHCRSDRNGTVSMHCYHSYAIQDRIITSSMSDDIPNISNVPLLSLNVLNVLPSKADHQGLLHNFAILVSRVLVEHMKYFRESYSNLVTTHIKHTYSEQMSMKSKIVRVKINIISIN